MFNTASCLLSHASARYYYQSTTDDPAASSFVEYKAATSSPRDRAAVPAWSKPHQFM